MQKFSPTETRTERSAPPTERVWLDIRLVMARTGRGRLRVLEALQAGRGHLDSEGAYRAGDLRGYQSTGGAGGVWTVHVNDVDSWMRGEAPAPVESVA